MPNAYDSGEWVDIKETEKTLCEMCGDKVEVRIHYFDGHDEIHDGEFVEDGILIPTAGNSFRNRYAATHVRKKH